jgi:dTDP-4-dehydrorhamnose reductase
MMERSKGKIVLVTGSSGMLGKDVVGVLVKNGYSVFATDIKKAKETFGYEQIVVDLLDDAALLDLLIAVDPETIVHCAANVNVDACEKEREQAYALHVKTTGRLASYRTDRTKFVYIASDSVYDGNFGGHLESEDAKPSNYYAQSKYEGEKAAIGANPHAIVLRTNIYGFHCPRGKSLVEWALESFHLGRQIGGFSDVWFNPLYTKQLATMISSLLNKEDISGVLNAGSADKVSKFDFLVKLASVFGYPAELVNSNSVENEKLTAPRPKDTTMNVDKMKALIGGVPNLMSGFHELKLDMELQATGGVDI